MSTLHIVLMRLQFSLPFAHSLKEKRQPLKSLKERLKNKFNASVAEIDLQDEWQQAVIGLTILSTDKSVLQRQCSLIEQFVLESTEMEVVDINVQWL